MAKNGLKLANIGLEMTKTIGQKNGKKK